MNRDPRIKLNWQSPYPHPGTWQQFCIREDNRPLTTEERRHKFVKEESLHYKFNNSSWLGAGAAGNTYTGQASDGPLNGATVTCNLGSTISNATGIFTFDDTPTGEIIVTGGTDSVTGIPYTGRLVGFPEYKTISPLTTLAYHLKEVDASLTPDSAINLLFVSSSTLFGIQLDLADKDVMLNKDYVGEAILNKRQPAIAAQSIATYLESVTEMVGSAVYGADGSNFTDDAAKIEAYRSIARQIQGTTGSLNAIDTTTLFDDVTLPNGNAWTSTGSLNTTARDTINTQVDNVRTELASLAQSEALSANYLTTQIQAVNRGVKHEYIEETNKLGRGRSATFKTINNLKNQSTGSIAKLESGKENDTDKTSAIKNTVSWQSLGGMTFTQEANGQSYTLSGDAVTGTVEVITRLEIGQYLNINKDSIRFAGATNYQKRSKEIIGTTTTIINDKVTQITLSNPEYRILSTREVDPPAANYLPRGRYTLQLVFRGGWNNLPDRSAPSLRVTNTTDTNVSADSTDGTSHRIIYSTDNSRYEYSNSSGGRMETKYYISIFRSDATWDKVDSREPDFRINIR